MSQYVTGTVNVTNGSATVTLVGGAAGGNVLQGNLFSVTDAALSGAGVWYTVAADAVADDSFSLTAPWAGDTAVGRTYGVHRDFSASGAPLWEPGDVNVPALYNRLIALLESGAIGGGGGGGAGLPSFFGHSSKALAVNFGETAVEYRDHRFLRDALTELDPATLSSRMVHYSALSGTFATSGGRVSQWNDLSGNNRHATADGVGPLPVGAAGRASYGLNFNSSADVDDDIKMIATVPAATTAMFLFVIGRCDVPHGASRNLLKTAHVGGVDSQTAGDIELSAVSSGNGLQLRVSTTAATNQVVPLGMLKNGLPFVLAIALNNGAITGWVQGQFQTAQQIATTYQHGAGFDTDRLRLGTSVDAVTAQTLHEVLLSSVLPSDANIQRLVLWARNRYFTSQLAADEADPRFLAPVRFSNLPLIARQRPVVATDGNTLEEYFPPGRSITPPVTIKADWSGGVLRHTGPASLTVTLPNTAAKGFELDLEQAFGTTGAIEVAFAVGGTNENGFGGTVPAGARLRVVCTQNTDGVSAAYAGYRQDGAGGGGGGSDLILASQAEAIAGVENTHYMSPLRVTESIAAQVAIVGQPFIFTEDMGDYSATPFTVADAFNVERWFSGAQDQIIEFVTGLSNDPAAHGSFRAPDANTLTIRRQAGQAVSINGVANDAYTWVVPAGGLVRWEVSDVNTYRVFGATLGSQTVPGPIVFIAVTETVNPLGNISGSVTVDFNLGTIATATLTGAVTALAFSNMPAGSTIRLLWNLASNTLAMPTGARFDGGVAPTLGTGLVDLIVTKTATGPDVFDVRVSAADVAAP